VLVCSEVEIIRTYTINLFPEYQGHVLIYYVCFKYEMGAKKEFNNMVGAVVGTCLPFYTTKSSITY